MNSLGRRRFQRLYSTKVILLCATITLFVVVTALVVLSGYVVSCNELHYETKRQLYGRTTLGERRVGAQGCQMAKFDPFLSLDCARVEGVGAQSKERKGSNFAA